MTAALNASSFAVARAYFESASELLPEHLWAAISHDAERRFLQTGSHHDWDNFQCAMELLRASAPLLQMPPTRLPSKDDKLP